MESIQRGAVKGIVKWQSRWMTAEEANANGVPVPAHAGEAVLPEHMEPGAIVNPEGVAHNLVTTVGLADFVKAMGLGLTADTKFSYIALGSSSTAVNTADTQLTAEVTGNGQGRASSTVSAQTTTLAGDTLQLVGVFTYSGTPVTTKEIGIGNNAAANTGTLLTHALTGDITLPAGTVVTFTYKVVFASA